MEECVIIEKIPGCKGIYGPRYWVPENLVRLNEIFTALSIWHGPTDRKSNDDGLIMLMYEMPLGYGNDIEDNPLIMKHLSYDNAVIV